MWLSTACALIAVVYPKAGYAAIGIVLLSMLASLKVTDTTSSVIWRERAVLLMVLALSVLIIL